MERKHSQRLRWGWLLRPDFGWNHEAADLHRTLQFVSPEPARRVQAARCGQQRCPAGGAASEPERERSLPDG